MDQSVIMLLAFIFGWPAVLILVQQIRGQVNERQRRRERAAARRMYERVIHHKLEVIETALAMGYAQDDVRRLDSRLESLIGTDMLRTLLDSKTPGIPVTGELPSDDDLGREIREMRKERERA
jgi:hypothetical protein